MGDVNQNQQWSINQPQQMNSQPQNMRPNWNNPVNPPVQMPQPGSPQWWQMMFNPNLMNEINMNQPTSQLNMTQQVPVQNTVSVQQTVNQISSARVITTAEDIKPSEMPVDDTVRLFLTDDLQTVYAKKWDNNGELKNMVFQRVPDVIEKTDSSVPVISQQDIDSQNDRISSLEDRLDALLNATTELSNKITKMEVNSSKSTAKKGSAANE